MDLPGANTIIVRHSEIGTKSSQVQAKMERQLGANLQEHLNSRKIPGSISTEYGRVFVHSQQPRKAANVAARTFGVISASPAIEVEPTESAIIDTVTTIAPTVYTEGSFAVRVRRAGPKERHSFTSQELESIAGSAIWESIESNFDPVVDLENPDITFSIECRDDSAYIFIDTLRGPGGFPYGTQGTVVSLISGGTDSPVAAYEMMRRGCTIVPVYFDFEEYGGIDHVARVVEATRKIASYTPTGKLSLMRVPIGDKVQELLNTTTETRMLSLRRLMFAIASYVADEVGAVGIATGEALGQKSSQTGPNLAATATVSPYPIHRPLLNEDKESIIRQAKMIGTYEESRIEAGCNRVAPSFPVTAATAEEVEEAEPPNFLAAIEILYQNSEFIPVSAVSNQSTSRQEAVQHGVNQR